MFPVDFKIRKHMLVDVLFEGDPGCVHHQHVSYGIGICQKCGRTAREGDWKDVDKFIGYNHIVYVASD